MKKIGVIKVSVAATALLVSSTSLVWADRTEFEAAQEEQRVERAEQADRPLFQPANQTLCPVNNTPIDRSIYRDYNGKRIYFSNNDAIQTFDNNPELYMQNLNNSGVVLDIAPQPGVEISVPVKKQRVPGVNR